MNRENTTLRMVDLKLRLYTEYCRNIDILYQRMQEIDEELNGGMIRTGSIIDISDKNMKPQVRNCNLIQLITEEAHLFEEYDEMIYFIEYMSKKFRFLNNEDLDLLYLRYERGLTLKQIGELKYYSYMQVQRMLDRVLEKIFFE